MRLYPQAAISASRDVPHQPERVYAFLARLENHRQLGDRRLRLKSLAADRRGGHVLVAGPLGIRRTVQTVIGTEERPVRFAGAAFTGETKARVAWSIEGHDDGSRVTLESTILRLGRVDQVLLSLGGTWWLRRRFAKVLDRLPGAVEACAGAGS